MFAARGADVPGYKPLLGADLGKASAWINAQPDWAPLEIVADFMRDRALETIPHSRGRRRRRGPR